MTRFLALMLLVVTTLLAKPAMASATCPDADLFSGALLNKFCWSCVFPIRVVGARIGSGSAPPGATNRPFCQCRNHHSLPSFGFTLAAWMPNRIVEVVKSPWCSIALGGHHLNNSSRTAGGYKSREANSTDKVFYHTHYMSFPIAYILQMLVSDTCAGGDYLQPDYISFSELNPIKLYDEVAMWFNPMSVVFSTPAAYLAQMADCVASTAGNPMSEIPGCMGCLGMLTPGANHVAAKPSPPQYTALLVGRELMNAHQSTLAKKTYGSRAALCGGETWPIIPKEQYRISQFYPVPQSRRRCCDHFGESQMLTREWRNIPGTGEDFLYVIFQFTECCIY